MKWQYTSGGETYEIGLQQSHDGLTVSFDGQLYAVEIVDQHPGVITFRIHGKVHTIYYASEGNKRWVAFEGCTHLLEKTTGRSARKAVDQLREGQLRAPMPAQIRSVLVAEGDPVEKGESLLLLEAMKMEIRLAAPFAGEVVKVNAKPGDSVERDQVLLELSMKQSGEEQA